MAITFPEGVDQELFYVPNSDLVLQYDAATNSWNIVGPDNLATIDYVDQTIATDATKTYRNSSLHKETNVLGVDTNKVVYVNTTCFNAATSSFSSDLKFTPGDDDNPDGEELGPNNWNPPEYLIATQNTIPEWHECIGNNMPRGTFSYVGHDLVTSNGSSEFRYILGFSMSKNDAEGNPSKLGPVIPGDTFEIYLDTTARSATSEVKFALYEVVEVWEGDNNITVSVLFLDSNTPEENVVAGLPYQLYSYGKTLEKTGGKISGDLKVVSDSENAFEVWRTEDDFADKTWGMVFQVDTTNNDIVVNQEYNDDFKIPDTEYSQEVNPLRVATVAYVNERLGVTLDERFPNEDGPYLRTAGGTVAKLEITNNSQGGLQNLVVRGITSTSNGKGDGIVLSTLNNAANNNLSEVNYYGPVKKDTAIATKKYVDQQIAGNQYDLSPFLKKDGTREATGKLVYSSNSSGYKTNIQDYNDRDIPCAKAVKNVSVATVYKGSSSTQGVLYETGGVLYYNTYE